MTRDGHRGSDLFIVDNGDKSWKVKDYLHEWAELAHTFDVATGYFEIGALLALDGQWQKLDRLRILMGDEVSRRTRTALLAGVESALDESIERAKEKNDFLTGVPAIVDAIQNRQIECKVYAKQKFHAKAYITHARQAVLGSMALVGSSNFTVPGLTDNIELNIQVRREVDLLQEWYERHWDEAEDITEDIFKVIERHTREYSPFEVYAKALQEYFKGHELTVGEWEKNHSKIYPILDRYQQEGYQALMKISRQYRGAFLCDGVGLGKTFVGMMLLERLVEYERKRVVLFVPKAARKPVWEDTLKKYLPHLGSVFSNLVIYNHTDLQREKLREELDRVGEMADAVVIDEAHHFRNPGVKGEGSRRPSRCRRLYELVGDKDLFLLTATPINNRLIDLQHMIELFSRDRQDYFKAAPLGIHSLSGHFRGMEKQLEKFAVRQHALWDGTETNQAEAEQVLAGDDLFRSLVVQRSRAYVKKSQQQQGGSAALFPEKKPPQVADYSIKKTYGKLLSDIEKAFNKDKPLFSLAIYYPLAYYKGPKEKIDTFSEGRQKQVVGLIRTLFLKRFESSARAFEISCQTLLKKLLAFVTKNSQTSSERSRLERWMAQNADLIGYVQQTQFDLDGDQEDEQDEDVIPEDVFHYAYAVFHSPTYRERYAEFLKRDFPRLPITTDLALFRELCGWGGELVSLHLMRSTDLDDPSATFPKSGSNLMEKAKHDAAGDRVYINKEGQYFEGVPEETWNFRVGGYQVLDKWLKDRKGRKLSDEDIEHYTKVVKALHETVRIMREIDEVIEAHGGWPLVGSVKEEQGTEG